jgi:hypothetical protein
MDFNKFREHCKHEHPGYNIDRQLEYTCRHPDNQPPHCSWGTCDKEHCPLYGGPKAGKE